MHYRNLIWIIPATIAVCWIASMTRDSTIEEAKQTAFMMKACVDAGGEFSTPWNRPSCARPKTHQ